MAAANLQQLLGELGARLLLLASSLAASPDVLICLPASQCASRTPRASWRACLGCRRRRSAGALPLRAPPPGRTRCMQQLLLLLRACHARHIADARPVSGLQHPRQGCCGRLV